MFLMNNKYKLSTLKELEMTFFCQLEVQASVIRITLFETMGLIIFILMHMFLRLYKTHQEVKFSKESIILCSNNPVNALQNLSRNLYHSDIL